MVHVDRALAPGIVDVFHGEFKGIDAGVVDLEGGHGFFRDLGFQFLGFGHGQCFIRNARFFTIAGKIGHVIFIIPFNGHKDAPGVFHAMGGGALDDFKLVPAFHGGLGIGTDVACARMEQPVVAARCPGVQVLFFHQDHVESTLCKIPEDTGSGYPAAYDQYIGFQMERLLLTSFKTRQG